MSEGYTKPKYPQLNPSVLHVGEDDDNGAREQILVLCEQMMRECLHQDIPEINGAAVIYYGKERDLYEGIIDTIPKL